MTELKKASSPNKAQFKPGHAPHPRAGRPKGAKNKFPRNITERIVAGIAASDKSIGAGIEGYAKYLADNHPSAAASLMTKLVVRGSDGANESADFYLPPQINILGMPSGRFFSADQIAAIREGRQVIDPSECEPMQLGDSVPANETPQSEHDDGNIVELKPLISSK